jgi:hypothetical protein
MNFSLSSVEYEAQKPAIEKFYAQGSASTPWIEFVEDDFKISLPSNLTPPAEKETTKLPKFRRSRSYVTEDQLAIHTAK